MNFEHLNPQNPLSQFLPTHFKPTQLTSPNVIAMSPTLPSLALSNLYHPGDICWLKDEEDCEESADEVTLPDFCFDHPVVILWLESTGETAAFFMVTSFGGTSLENKHPYKELRKLHVPICPSAPNWELGGLRLELEDGQSLRKNSYVKIEFVRKCKLSSLLPKPQKLTAQSLKRLLEFAPGRPVEESPLNETTPIAEEDAIPPVARPILLPAPPKRPILLPAPPTRPILLPAPPTKPILLPPPPPRPILLPAPPPRPILLPAPAPKPILLPAPPARPVPLIVPVAVAQTILLPASQGVQPASEQSVPHYIQPATFPSEEALTRLGNSQSSPISTPVTLGTSNHSPIPNSYGPLLSGQPIVEYGTFGHTKRCRILKGLDWLRTTLLSDEALRTYAMVLVVLVILVFLGLCLLGTRHLATMLWSWMKHVGPGVQKWVVDSIEAIRETVKSWMGIEDVGAEPWRWARTVRCNVL
ncbi:hypothetical protein BT63DRAFT_476466 [Microthyrium microscopicum]|uniref:Uncharacterized protein n=1 Tax=Microthyrium microscopicum TaxID=703497 RepID=A0A6A6UH33_9PEZI|nr:hypothetical protein BT63DRAFT_476466 [Microthyrium microscopicum]